jgi:hypothetical protein
VTIARILKDASRRVAELDIGGWVWIALLTAATTGFDLLNTHETSDTAMAAAAFAVTVILFAAVWKLTRKLGKAGPEEKGSVILWLAWSFIALVPVVFSIAYLYLTDPGFDDPPLFRILLEACAISVLVPVWVHVAGTAIASGRTTLKVACAVPLVSLFAVTFGLALLQSWVFELMPQVADTIADQMKEWPKIVVGQLVSSLITLAILAVTVSAWRALPGAGGVALDDPLG